MNCFSVISLNLRSGAIDRDGSLRYPPPTASRHSPSLNTWNHPAFEAAGKAYYNFRAALIVRNDDGMPKTYNRASTPPMMTTPTSPSSGAYTPPWTVPSSLPTAGATSRLTANSSSTTGSAKPSGAGRRGRTATAGRNHPRAVLARLIALNAERAAEEARAGAVASGSGGRMRAVRPVG